MKVLVDTSVWSLALRRQAKATSEPIAGALITLIEDGRVAIKGPIRQEIISGIKERAHFERLRDRLRAFPDIVLESDDYEEAAAFFNQCRAKGIQGSNTDFLICAVAARRELAIFTTDDDFGHYARVLPIVRYNATDR